MWLAAPDARAGSYILTSQTGGITTVTVPSPPGPPAQNYGSVTGGYGGGGGTGSSTATQTGSVNCSGAITTVYTWQPAYSGEPPPANVIICESCTAKYNSHTYLPGGMTSPACDNGLGDPSVPTSTPLYNPGNPPTVVGTDVTVSCTGAHYRTMPWQATVTLTCNPKANISISNGWGSASVAYSVTVSPVQVNIGGTKDPTNGDFRALTGQQITGTLSGIPTNFKVTKYTWTQPSATCFKTYSENAASNQLVALSSADLTKTDTTGNGLSVSPVNFYDRKQENLTVKCAVSLTAPDGTALSATASSPQINVLKPTLTHWGITEGYVQLAGDGSAFGLYGNLKGTGNSVYGMIWSNATVNVPAPFSGNGQCTFTQLVNPDHLEYINGSSIAIGLNNGILGLDGSFKYGNSWSVTAMGNDVDNPNQPLFYKTGLTEISVSDAFTTYVMYQPNGGVWVPIDKISWTWGMTLIWQPQTGQFSLTASYPATAGQAPTPTPAAIDDPPQWTVIQNP